MALVGITDEVHQHRPDGEAENFGGFVSSEKRNISTENGFGQKRTNFFKIRSRCSPNRTEPVAPCAVSADTCTRTDSMKLHSL